MKFWRRRFLSHTAARTESFRHWKTDRFLLKNIRSSHPTATVIQNFLRYQKIKSKSEKICSKQLRKQKQNSIQQHYLWQSMPSFIAQSWWRHVCDYSWSIVIPWDYVHKYKGHAVEGIVQFYRAKIRKRLTSDYFHKRTPNQLDSMGLKFAEMEKFCLFLHSIPPPPTLKIFNLEESRIFSTIQFRNWLFELIWGSPCPRPKIH